MDLLLHLLREDELDAVTIPVARVCDQFLEYVKDLDRIDIDSAGDFLVMASTLLRMKSQALLPEDEQVLDDEELDPRFDLVRQLIQYRRYKQVADLLATRREDAARRFPRGMHPEMAETPRASRPLRAGEADVELLFRAFARLLREIRPHRDYVVTVDDTPLSEHFARVEALLPAGARLEFRHLLPRDATRGFAIGMLLALLELLKQGRIDVQQDGEFGEIVVIGCDPTETATAETSG